MTSTAYTILTHPDLLPDTPGRKLLVGGLSVFTTLNGATEPPPGFVRQAPRHTGTWLHTLTKSPAAVSTYLHPALLDRSRPKTRLALTLDAYLRWGVRNASGWTAVLGGVEDASGTYVEQYVFHQHQLVALSEHVLPRTQSAAFSTAAAAIIDELRTQHPGIHIAIAAPLTAWALPDTDYIGDAPLKRLRFVPATDVATPMSRLRVPIAIAATAALGYLATIAYGWSSYQHAVDQYNTAIADPVVSQAGGLDHAMLDAMQQRRIYMDAPRRQEALAERTIAIIRGLSAVPGVHIRDLRLPAPSLQPQATGGVSVVASNEDPRAPDAQITITVPITTAAAVDEAKSVLTQISNQTALDVRLTHSGWRDDQATGTRELKIEGFFHE